MDFQKIMSQQQDCRTFSHREVNGDDVTLLLRAALLSLGSCDLSLCEFIVVDDRETLEKLSDAREQETVLLRDAALAVVVLGNDLSDNHWVEHGTIAAVSMQYQAEELGIGSCWMQIRDERLSDGTDSEQIVRGILDIPEDMRILCVVGFGQKEGEKEEKRGKWEEEDLKWENVHIGRY